MEQKDCRGKEGLPDLWEKGSRRTRFCFCCVSFTRRKFGGLELRTNCVSTISFPPLSTASCTAIRHKTAAGIWDLAYLLAAGQVFLFFFFLRWGFSFPPPLRGRHISIPDCVNVCAMFNLFNIWSLLFLFFFFYYDHFLRTNSEGRAGVMRHIYEWTDHIQPDIHNSFSVDLNLQMYGYLKKKERRKKWERWKNKYLIFFLKKLPLCNTSLGAEINDEANEASL